MISLPSNPGESGWSAILPERASQPALGGNVVCDVLVIGAGFAGLTAARRLRQLQPNLSIVILEGASVAEGPAGRNSGFMIDLPHDISSDDYHSKTSAAEDVRQTNMNRAAIRYAQEIADHYSMPVTALQASGKVNAAATDKGHRHNLGYADHLANLNEPHRLLNADQMRELTGIDYYQSGLFTPGTVMLQPAEYIRAFADGLVSEDVLLFENSPVISLECVSGSWMASTPDGSVRAAKVILAVNGMVERFGFYRDRLMHVFTYASMTRPLTESETEALGGQPEWAFTPADAQGTTVRKIMTDAGPRIVIRNRFTYDGNMTVPANRITKVGQLHDRAFQARFSMLNQVGMDYRWGGRLCLSLNGVGAIGEVQPNLYSACCQNGLGTARGTLSGIVAAEQVCGSDETLVCDYKPEPMPTRLPPKSLMNLGANVYLRFKESQAGAEL